MDDQLTSDQNFAYSAPLPQIGKRVFYTLVIFIFLILIFCPRATHGECQAIEHNLSPYIEEMGSFASKEELLKSNLYKNKSKEIDDILNSVQLCSRDSVRAKINDFIRIVSWNIERGKELKGILDFLSNDQTTSLADIILFQEVDLGMARSGNKDIASEIASYLKMHHTFATQFLELNKMEVDAIERKTPNEKNIFGIAILSRYPILKTWAITLHDCFASYKWIDEPRLGRRRALVAVLNINGEELTVVNVHLSVFATPRCRLKQVKDLINGLKDIKGPILIGGDFNTTTLRLGSKFQEITEAFRFIFSNLDDYTFRITHPESIEPLFRYLDKHYFDYREANSWEKITSYVKLKEIPEIKWLPDAIERRVLENLDILEYRIPMNLDWFFLRGLKPLQMGQKSDPSSIGPFAATPQIYTESALSDHAPILIDIPLP